jgi:vacuolar-type H+-ATPase subunit I/STV1
MASAYIAYLDKIEARLMEIHVELIKRLNMNYIGDQPQENNKKISDLRSELKTLRHTKRETLKMERII